MHNNFLKVFETPFYKIHISAYFSKYLLDFKVFEIQVIFMIRFEVLEVENVTSPPYKSFIAALKNKK